MTATASPSTGPFEKTKGWLDWYDGPSKPHFSCRRARSTRIATCSARAPSSLTRPSANTRPATRARQSSSRCAIISAFARNVVVQATCHGADNRAMVDALSFRAAAARAASRPSGAASATRSCKRLHDAGVRGVRFNFVKRLVDFTPKDELMEIAGRIEKLGWHVVIYFEAVDLPELWDFFTALPTTVVVDHMGRPDVTKPVDGPEFALFLKFMREQRQCLGQGVCPSGCRSPGRRR